MRVPEWGDKEVLKKIQIYQDWITVCRDDTNQKCPNCNTVHFLECSLDWVELDFDDMENGYYEEVVDLMHYEKPRQIKCQCGNHAMVVRDASFEDQYLIRWFSRYSQAELPDGWPD